MKNLYFAMNFLPLFYFYNSITTLPPFVFRRAHILQIKNNNIRLYDILNIHKDYTTYP